MNTWKDVHDHWLLDEMQTKTTKWYYYPHAKMAEIKKTDNTKYCWDCEITGTFLVGMWCKRAISENNLAIS